MVTLATYTSNKAVIVVVYFPTHHWAPSCSYFALILQFFVVVFDL